MSAPITAEKIKDMIRDLVREQVGLTLKEHEEKQAQEAKAKAQADEVQRKHTADLTVSKAPKKYRDLAEKEMRADRLGGAGFRLARYVRCLAAAKQLDQPPEVLAKSWGDDDLAQAFVHAREKALATSTASGGGILVHDEYASELIELLRADSVMYAAGCRRMDIPGGQMRLGRQSSAATAYYGVEGTNFTISQPALDELVLFAKKLTGLVPFTNDLLRNASIAADQWVRDDLSQVMSLRQDLAFIRGDGSSNTPRGLRNQVHADHTNAMTATPDLADVTADTLNCIELLVTANHKIKKGFWLMHPRSQFFIGGLRDSNGNLGFPEMLGASPRLWTYPVAISTQIPINLSTNQSEVYFADADELVIGEKMGLQIETFPNGTYYDTTASAMVSGISRDESQVRAISEHDFLMRHNTGAAVITGVTWGV